MKLIKGIFIVLILIVFVFGLSIFLYPMMHGHLVDQRIQQAAEEFLSRVEIDPYIPAATDPQEEPEVLPSEPALPSEYTDLWLDMVAYNDSLYTHGQEGLDCEYAYEEPSFLLADYGLEDEIFAVISIPVLDLEMPIYLGATSAHMADGAAHMSQTSLPIGGENTNCVIAGHRGWRGAPYFRYINELEIGDTVTITNLWETLTYKVVEIRIIQPNDIDAILIQPNRELVTLLTCHPYASGGRQRYLVICERIETQSISNNTLEDIR